MTSTVDVAVDIRNGGAAVARLRQAVAKQQELSKQRAQHRREAHPLAPGKEVAWSITQSRHAVAPVALTYLPTAHRLHVVDMTLE